MEATTKNEKRSSRVSKEGKEGKVARFKQTDDGWLVMITSSPGAASSSQAPIGAPGVAEKRTLKERWGEDEMPQNSHKISSVCIGYDASDKIGEGPCQKEYE